MSFPRMRWILPRLIVGGIRTSPGLIQPREILTLHAPAKQWYIHHLNDCFHCWDCISGSCKEDLLLSSNGKPLLYFIELYLPISNQVAFRHSEDGSLVVRQGQVYLPHKRLWGKFQVAVMFNLHLDDQYSSASFDLQQLKLLILFTRHTSLAYNK